MIVLINTRRSAPTIEPGLILAVGNDSQFVKFCDVAGLRDIPKDVRFARNAERVRHRTTLVPLLATVMKTRTRSEWLAALEVAKVPCGPINDLAEVFADPQVLARGMTTEMAHPLAGSVRLVASPMRFSVTPVQYRRAPPLLGPLGSRVGQHHRQAQRLGAGLDHLDGLRMAIADRKSVV